MKFIGKIQELYRISIPKNVCDVMGFKKGMLVEVDVEKAVKK